MMEQPRLVALGLELRCRSDECPAHQDGRCRNHYDPPHVASVNLHAGIGCAVFKCEECLRFVPWCFGGGEDDLCDDCWCRLRGEKDSSP